MWRLKSCPRCNGDMFIDKDRDFWYEECLQCGFSRQLADMVVVSARPADTKDEARSDKTKTAAKS